ncbi:hypothetical protein E2C01_030353 [Portunus trituberculatus]|uniref:Uncharacterized protein n=1 Tax=Portunus trituberculatus TaxID=210409 RepID=A0A5B7EX30_PORTR|nr:hypothetical protein [Portunus trituberculatus]
MSHVKRGRSNAASNTQSCSHTLVQCYFKASGTYSHSPQGMFCTVLIDHTKQTVEDDDEGDDGEPEDGWQASPLVSVSMHCYDVVFVRWSCREMW